MDQPHFTNRLWSRRPVSRAAAAFVPQLVLGNEHAAIFNLPEGYDSLCRRDDFLAEGVHAVFGLRDGEAHLQALVFQADAYDPTAARYWLDERNLRPILFAAADNGMGRDGDPALAPLSGLHARFKAPPSLS